MKAPLEIYLICFAVGSVIHGVQTVLIACLIRERAEQDRLIARNSITLGVATFLWQFGNFITVAGLSVGPADSNVAVRVGIFIREFALVCFPLVFCYLSLHVPAGAET